MIAATPSKLHWNYFLALEHDLDQLSRYVEFAEPNYGVYSIELAHLLFAASSEVDVVAKQLCQLSNPNEHPDNINEYRARILPLLPELPDSEVFVPRYGLSFKPWSNWAEDINPLWWKSYNNVKHQRNVYFNEATLKNALNSLGALLLLTIHYYSRELADQPGQILSLKDTTGELLPHSSLLRLAPRFYYDNLVV